MFEQSDVPKYRKKRTTKPPKKADHTHIYSDCIGRRTLKKSESPNPFIYFFAKKCSVCGKMSGSHSLFTEDCENGCCRMLVKIEEIKLKYPDLDVVDI